MKSTLNNNIVFYKCMCEVNQDYTYHKEYITIKTEKKIGEKYSSTYQFESSSVSDKPENYSIKVNNREINTYRPTFFFQNFSASIDYELQPEEDSVVTFEINSKIKTGIYHSFARVYCKNINSPFSFRVKCSDYFIFNSPSDYNFTNVFKVISAREILLKGNKHQNYLNFSFKSKNDIILPKNDKAFYYCNEKELKELEFVINSTRIKFNEINVIGVKEIYTIKKDICTVKSYITFFRPHEGISCPGGSYLFDLEEYTDLKYINATNNQKDLNKIFEPSLLIGKSYLKLHYSLEEHDFFGTNEFDYSFRINYSYKLQNFYINFGHYQIIEGGYFHINIKIDPLVFKNFRFAFDMNYTYNEDECAIDIKAIYKHRKYRDIPFNALFLKK